MSERVYMACTADNLELPVTITDTRQQMAEALGVHISYITLLINGQRSCCIKNPFRVPVRVKAVELVDSD